MSIGIEFWETLFFGICQYALWNVWCAHNVSSTSHASLFSTVTSVISALVTSHLYYKDSSVPCLSGSSLLQFTSLIDGRRLQDTALITSPSLPPLLKKSATSLTRRCCPCIVSPGSWGERGPQECLLVRITWDILRQAFVCLPSIDGTMGATF